MKTRYFYTVDYPHRWTSGPQIYRFNETYGDIGSLEEAKRLAELHRVESYDEGRAVTTYGVEYIEDN